MALPTFARSLVIFWRRVGWSRPSRQSCEKPGSLTQMTTDIWQFQLLIPLSKQITQVLPESRLPSSLSSSLSLLPSPAAATL